MKHLRRSFHPNVGGAEIPSEFTATARKVREPALTWTEAVTRFEQAQAVEEAERQQLVTSSGLTHKIEWLEEQRKCGRKEANRNASIENAGTRYRRSLTDSPLWK